MLKDYQIEELEDDHGPIPRKMHVCPTCDGKGKSLPESLSGDVTEMVNEDPDFAEDYFSGAYDRVCRQCDGLRVVEGFNYEAMKPEMLAAIQEKEDINDEIRREMEQERRMGC